MAVLKGMNEPHNPHSVMKHRDISQHMVSMDCMPNQTGQGLPVNNKLTRDWSLNKLSNLQYTDTTPMGGNN